MGFTSYSFIFFFIPVLILGWQCINVISIRHRVLVSEIFLICMSLIFYGWNNAIIIAMFLPVLLFNWVGVFLMQIIDRKNIRIGLCTFMLICNVGVWLVPKYGSILNIKIVDRSSLIVPLGISFYTIQQIMFLVDSYRNQNLKYNLAEYMAYSTYFPCIISGPIVKHDEFIPQLQNRFKEKNSFSDNVWMRQGIISFSLGMGKKVIVAKQLGILADYGFSQSTSISSDITILCIVAYSLQLYFDFSGYCDMAEGISLILGFSLPRNFESPYKARSISEFWKKWHTTLTRFLTQYVYIPLGGSRHGVLRKSVNILIVFMLSGVWHGASLTYILWGGMHAVLMIINNLMKGIKYKKLPDGIRRGISFILISLAWVPFRAENIGSAIIMYKNFFQGVHKSDEIFWRSMFEKIFPCLNSLLTIPSSYMAIFAKLMVIFFIICILFIIFRCKNVRQLREQYADNVIMAIVCGIILWMSVMRFTTASTFIYEGF